MPVRTAVRARWALGWCSVAVAVLAAGLAACSSGPGEVTVSPSGCGSNWEPASDGRLDTAVRNVGNAVLRVDLDDATGAGVYASVPALAPGATWQLRATLPNGGYRLVCTGISGAPARSAVGRVTASSSSGPRPVRMLSSAEVQAISRSYSMQLQLRLPVLAADVDRLQAAVGSGDLAGGRQRWLVAHADYESLGAAYGMFGDSADRIDGLPDGLPGGVQDPGFTGFHRVEYLLWHDGSAAVLNAATAQLAKDVSDLVGQTHGQSVPEADVVRSSHEILEATLRFALTGGDDFGSGSGLVTVQANLAGTEQALNAVASPLQSRDPALLARARQGLTALAAQMRGLCRPDGSCPAPAALGPGQRQDLDASVSAQLETLALIPTTLQAAAVGDPD